MDQRLIPLNGLLALVRGDGGWPSALGDQGFRVHLVEAPVYSEPANIRVDAILYRLYPALILLCECKGGRNVEPRQARSYLAAELDGLRGPGTLPPELRGSDAVKIRTVFVGRTEMRADLLASLAQFDLEAPVLTLGRDRATLTDVPADVSLDEFDVEHDAGLPPARFPIDSESPAEEIVELVVQHLVAAQARSEEFVPVAQLARAILPGFAILGREAQREFSKRVEAVTQQFLVGDLAKQFRFERSQAYEPRVAVVRTPASADPRGATQQWQAQGRRVRRALGREGQKPAIEGQISLDELAREGGIAND